MPNFNEQVAINLSGDWNNGGPSIGQESLIVSHSENGVSPAVTLMNDGGGHFIVRFQFAGDSNIPGGEAASLWADWHGLSIAAFEVLKLVIGDKTNTPQIQISNGVTAMTGSLALGVNAPGSKFHVVGGPDQFGTVRFQPDASKGPWQSHVHWDPTGDWYIRSADARGKVIIQDQDATAFVGIGTAAPTEKLDVIGNVKVSGDVILTGGADCAEDFDIANIDEAEPGCVMVLDDDGRLEKSHQPYDKRVAGVISGAGSYKPAITLDKQAASPNRKSVALLGKVFCKADAAYAAIEVGDLLTTSATAGHAMKAVDSTKAFGAVIGKALKPLAAGQGLIPILVALQ